ncbi:hypothetical protein R80B4_02252 [Fibrobacteres bacterium R8-0-B4]
MFCGFPTCSLRTTAVSPDFKLGKLRRNDFSSGVTSPDFILTIVP